MARIQYRRGDIFESDAQVIVNTVNCKGVMGKGLALAFKQKYPDMFNLYKQDCKTGRLHIGRPTLYQKSNPWILNFPTKDDWRQPSKLEYLAAGLEYLAANYKTAGIRSIAFPKLGAQNGKLSWTEVGPLMATYLSKLDIDVCIYITEDDTEYQSEGLLGTLIEEGVWKQFSEVALSLNRLQDEVHLSKKAAKLVFDKRQTTEILSQACIDTVPLAKRPLEQIKKYIREQYAAPTELPGMNCESNTKVNPKKSLAGKKKEFQKKTELSETSLFSSHAMV
ncbi:MAG: hypothetical protein NVSMB54_07260 [Ktedonobacteraceae bacterium]